MRAVSRWRRAAAIQLVGYVVAQSGRAATALRTAGRAAATLLFTAAAAQAQTLSLHDALARADSHAFGNRIADAQAETEAAQMTRALQGILPALQFEGGYVRTNDPIGAFGIALRQRRIAQQDFDPARLNHPGPVTNHVGAVVLQQPLLNADAHLGRLAARRAAEASTVGAAWARIGTRLEVVKAYYGAMLAAEKVVTLEAARRAAEGHLEQAAKVVRAGLATRSDELLARVRAGEVEVQLIEARAEAALALRQLALVLGTPADTVRVPATLPSAAVVRQLLQDKTGAQPVERADVKQAGLGAQAAGMDVQRARSLYLPRLNAFARYDWNSVSSPFAGDGNWSVGVMAVWTPFAGASEWAERQATSGRHAAARVGLEAARAQAQLEAEAAASRREVARLRLEMAERAAEQSMEAHRIVARKYDGGLATVLELLDASAVETQSGLALSHARYTGITAEAEWRRALGLDPAGITALLDSTHTGAN